MTGPLAGIKVLDLSQIVSGPMAVSMLADQGAEVVKVESPGGDPLRWLGPRKGDRSAMFISVNRGKRSIVVDLKTRQGREVVERLVGWADVLVENFRPGTMERLGLGSDHCLGLNPRLVFASITGFGPDGPYSNIRVYDPVVQAVSGIAATQTDRDGKPGLVRNLVADKVTALTAAQAITAALFQRERTGQGQRLDIAMLDAAVAFNWPDGMWNHGFLDDPPPQASEYGRQMRLWDTSDGQVAIGALQDVEWVALARAVDRPDLADDPRFRGAGRVAHAQEWAPQITQELMARDTDALMAAFVREGAVGGRVNALAEVPADPQVIHNGTCVEIDHGGDGRVRGSRPPARFGAADARVAGPAPCLGEHGEAVLAMLRVTPADAAALVAAGAVVPRRGEG